MNAALASGVARAAFKYHADPSRLHQPRRVGMRYKCRGGELLTRAAIMHHDDKWHSTLKHHAALKGMVYVLHNEIPGSRDTKG